MTKSDLFKFYLSGIILHDLYADGTIINKAHKNI